MIVFIISFVNGEFRSTERYPKYISYLICPAFYAIGDIMETDII